MAHTNAVFSKFPIKDWALHPLDQARDIIEAELDVAGHSLVVYSNHWKSGASNPKREPVRVQNATVLRRLIEARLEADPFADLIVGGDLNSHYNHSILNPGLKTGINHVLGSQGDEYSIQSLEGPDLYNLWFELEPEARYSEVWRGRRGTLMHVLVTRGLYDSHGVGYIDGSFGSIQVPGLNVDAIGRPLEWSFAGDRGAGVSDHLPLIARFEIRDGRKGEFVELEAWSKGDDAPDVELPLEYVSGMRLDLELEDGTKFNQVSDDALSDYVGKMFTVRAEVKEVQPLSIEVHGVLWPAYVPNPEVFKSVQALHQKGAHRFVVRPGFWKGKRQWVIDGHY